MFNGIWLGTALLAGRLQRVDCNEEEVLIEFCFPGRHHVEDDTFDVGRICFVQAAWSRTR